MEHPETHVVTERNGPRPAGPPDRCFYCAAALGAEHEPSCVCRTRTVVVRLTVEYTVSVPADWTAEQVEHQRNEGSWCAGNMLAELARIEEVTGGCLCPLEPRYEMVREATAEDEGLTFGKADA